MMTGGGLGRLIAMLLQAREISWEPINQSKGYTRDQTDHDKGLTIDPRGSGMPERKLGMLDTELSNTRASVRRWGPYIEFMMLCFALPRIPSTHIVGSSPNVIKVKKNTTTTGRPTARVAGQGQTETISDKGPEYS
jgi:hypothetical protein